MRVLVVEDSEPMARAIVTGLRREGMAVDVVYDGGEALGHLAVTRYDVVALDRDLPRVYGGEICRQMATGRYRPVHRYRSKTALPVENCGSSAPALCILRPAPW